MSKFFTLENFQYVYGRIKNIYATKEALNEAESQLSQTADELSSELNTTKAALDEAKTSIETVETEVENLKSNTITQDELEAAIAEAGVITFSTVDELPSEGTPGTIYLLKNEENVDEGEEPAPTSYIQYIYQDGEWKEIGQAKLNMDGYMTKGEFEAATQEDIDEIMNDAGSEFVDMGGDTEKGGNSGGEEVEDVPNDDVVEE